MTMTREEALNHIASNPTLVDPVLEQTRACVLYWNARREAVERKHAARVEKYHSDLSDIEAAIKTGIVGRIKRWHTFVAACLVVALPVSVVSAAISSDDVSNGEVPLFIPIMLGVIAVLFISAMWHQDFHEGVAGLFPKSTEPYRGYKR